MKPAQGSTPDAAVRHVGLVGASLVAWAIGSYAYFLVAGRVVAIGLGAAGIVAVLIAHAFSDAVATWLSSPRAPVRSLCCRSSSRSARSKARAVMPGSV